MKTNFHLMSGAATAREPRLGQHFTGAPPMKELRSFINLLSSDIIQDPPVLIQTRLDVFSIDISYLFRYPLVENNLKWKRLQLQVTVDGKRSPTAGWQYVLCASVFVNNINTATIKSSMLMNRASPLQKQAKT